MKGSALTPLVRIAVIAQALGFIAFYALGDKDWGLAALFAAILFGFVAELLVGAAKKRLVETVEASLPGQLDSYSVRGWHPLFSKRDRRVWQAARDPILDAVVDLRLDLRRVRDMMPWGAGAQLILLTFLMSRIWAR